MTTILAIYSTVLFVLLIIVCVLQQTESIKLRKQINRNTMSLEGLTSWIKNIDTDVNKLK